MDLQDQEATRGALALDKVLARLAARTVGDIDQQGAAPAMVIVGDVHIGGNNVICLGGNCAEALQQIIAKLTQDKPAAEKPQEP